VNEIQRSVLDETNYLFDGFAHRRFEPSIDGWRNTQIQRGEFNAVEMAQSILSMADEINRLRRENWELRRDLKMNAR